MSIGQVWFLYKKMYNGQGVYILKSQKNLRYYIGSTNDISRRLRQHCKGDVKATMNIRPLELVFFQNYDQLAIARKIEYKLKKLKNKNILERIIKEKAIKLGP